MNNIEAKIFDPIATALRAEFDGIYVTGEYVDAPPSFPAVSIIEADNYMDTERMSSQCDEEYSVVMYDSENLPENLPTEVFGHWISK